MFGAVSVAVLSFLGFDARDRWLPAVLSRAHPVRRVPVNATLLVAAVSLALGIVMSTREDGITLLSTLVNFGALSAFLLLHVSVVVHHVVRGAAATTGATSRCR